MLITADGSIDCQENPNEQEMTTASLHYCELVAALGLLAKGGSFVLKAFTLFEHPSICSIYLIGALFEVVSVFKPATSKPGNRCATAFHQHWSFGEARNSILLALEMS
jgi:cap2 methyltransferase